MPSPKPDPAVADERAAIDAEVDGQTLGSILARNAELYWNEPALSWKHAHDDAEWQRMTWKDYRERVAEAALGLRSARRRAAATTSRSWPATCPST